MKALKEYRRRLAEIATESTVILGIIADAENRLNELKKEVKEIYEKADDILDKNSNNLLDK
jgi:phage shock protein A